MMPPAPGRLSTMNCWPVTSLSLVVKMRATVSVAAPGALGRIMRTGFSGYAAGEPCAQHSIAATDSAPSRRCKLELDIEDLPGERLQAHARTIRPRHGSAACAP